MTGAPSPRAASLQPDLLDVDGCAAAIAAGGGFALRLRALHCLGLPPRARDGRFIDWVVGLPESWITPAQRAQVVRLAWRYRAQLPAHLRPAADPDAPAAREGASS